MEKIIVRIFKKTEMEKFKEFEDIVTELTIGWENSIFTFKEIEGMDSILTPEFLSENDSFILKTKFPRQNILIKYRVLPDNRIETICFETNEEV